MEGRTHGSGNRPEVPRRRSPARDKGLDSASQSSDSASRIGVDLPLSDASELEVVVLGESSSRFSPRP